MRSSLPLVWLFISSRFLLLFASMKIFSFFSLTLGSILIPSFVSCDPFDAPFFKSQPPQGLSTSVSVRWLDCSDKEHPNFVCTYINVPKDYQNSSAGIASIALAKLPASSKSRDRLGAIFINPGGPGEFYK